MTANILIATMTQMQFLSVPLMLSMLAAVDMFAK